MGAYEYATHKIISMEVTYSWGCSPGSGRIKVAGDWGSPAPWDGATIAFGGHVFRGVVASNPSVLQDGAFTTFDIVDQRVYLMAEQIPCGFNFGEVREDNPDTPGIDRQKRWWHIYPEDWDSQTKTWTDAPLTAKAIMEKLAAASEWGWVFNYVADHGKPVYDIDGLNGSKLGTLLNEISEQQGLVFTLSDDFTLSWCRKGYVGDSPWSSFPAFPKASWDRKSGEAMSNLDTEVRIIGERNRYQDMPITLDPSWNLAWEQFWSEPAWLLEVDNQFGPFADEEQASLFAKARSVTVREYCDKVGANFQDYGKWGEVSRMEIPAWIYIQDIVFKAYEVPSDYTVNGIDVRSLQLFDGLMAAVTYSIDDGSFTLKDPREFYPEAKAFVVAKGQPIELLDPRTQGVITKDQLDAAATKWTAQNKFNLDVANRVVHFEHAVFQPGTGDAALFLFPNQAAGIEASDPLYNIAVPNPNATASAAEVQAVLCWEAERYSKTYGGGIRSGAKHVGSLCYHAIMLSGVFTEEVPYADSEYADDKADKIGEVAAKAVEFYLVGGYKRHASGTVLDSTLDRVSVSLSFEDAIVETVEFAKERAAQVYEGERSLDRKARQHDLFPHQKKNKDDVERLGQIANISRELKRSTRPHYETMAELLAFPVGAVNSSPAPVKVDSGKAGQPIFMGDDGTIDLENGRGFQGVLVHDVTDPAIVALATQGIVPVRVTGPFKAGDAIGVDVGDTDAKANGDRLVGIAQFPTTLETVVLVPVQLGAAARHQWFNFELYDCGDQSVAVIYGTLNDTDPVVQDPTDSPGEPVQSLGTIAISGEVTIWLIGNISKDPDSGEWMVDDSEIDVTEPGEPDSQCWTKIGTVISHGDKKPLEIKQNLRASQWFTRCRDDGTDDKFGGR